MQAEAWEPYTRKHWSEDFDTELASIEKHRARTNEECDALRDRILERKADAMGLLPRDVA